MSEFLIEERYASSLQESVFAMEGITFYNELLQEEELVKENFLGKNQGRSGGVVRALNPGRAGSQSMLESSEKVQ